MQPKATAGELLEELAAWERLGVEGHFEADRAWFSYHELLTEPTARLVGAQPSEVVTMNSLTVNLHLLMVSFYRPRGARTQIVVEDSTFPSDSYAVRSQAAYHGLDPDREVVRLGTDEVITYLERHGDSVALVLLGGVNFLTGELLDIPAITAAGHAVGAIVGWDLAHAAGNVPLALHEWDVDFAAWCSYKYLNAGPGSVAGAFVHQRHLGAAGTPRFEGWWSTAAATRFEMAAIARPPASADAWQVSNPPILAMSPVRTSLELFDKVGMPALRDRSVELTRYLHEALDELLTSRRDRPGDAERSAAVAVPSSRCASSGRSRSPGGCARSTASSSTPARPTSSVSPPCRCTPRTTTAGVSPMPSNGSSVRERRRLPRSRSQSWVAGSLAACWRASSRGAVCA